MGNKIEDFPAHVQKQIRRKIAETHRAPDPVAHVEQDPCDAPEAEDAVEGIDTPVCVHFHSIRKRLPDIDNLSGKAALDGIIEAGVLASDKASIVKAVTHTQKKGTEEQTIIEITEALEIEEDPF